MAGLQALGLFTQSARISGTVAVLFGAFGHAVIARTTSARYMMTIVFTLPPSNDQFKTQRLHKNSFTFRSTLKRPESPSF